MVGLNRKEFIESQAEILLSKYDVEDAIGIDLKEFINKLKDVEVEKDGSMDSAVSGFLLMTKGKNKIVVNGTQGKNRQRFTIAHELGHLMLHSQDEELFIDERRSTKIIHRSEYIDPKSARKEQEANAFAAAFLMPRKLIKQEYLKLSRDLSASEICKALSKAFKVSDKAIEYRLVNLGILEASY